MYISNHTQPCGENFKRIPWWSIGKTVLATAIMVLVEQNKLELDQHYMGLKGSLKQILRHESGLNDYGRLPSYHQAVANNEGAWSIEKLLEDTEIDTLIYQPSKGWLYSNIGYYYISKIIEETTNLSLCDALQRLIFDPLEIKDVTLAINKSDLKECVGVIENYDPKWVYHGLLVGSLKSACLFMDALAKGQLISQRSLEVTLNPYQLEVDLGNRPWKEPSYGHGVMIDNQEGASYCYGHTGGGPDSVIAVYHFPRLDPVITVGAFANNCDQDVVENTLYKIISELYNR